MKIPKQVQDYCKSKPMCKGCDINCVAPVCHYPSDKYDKWLSEMINKVMAK